MAQRIRYFSRDARVRGIGEFQRHSILCPICWPMYIRNCRLCDGHGEIEVKSIKPSEQYL